MTSPGFAVTGLGATKEEIVTVQKACAQHRFNM